MSQDNSKKDSDIVTIDVQPLLSPVAIILGSIIIGVTNLVGPLGSKALETPSPNTNQVTPTPEEFPATTTSIDDDPIKGDKSKAKVAIVEFSDYECPVCKYHFQGAYKEIVEKYLKTNQAIIVFRDFPLTRHDPLATKQALAAECVHEKGGDEKYFEYHDLIFKNTASNGNGMKEDDLYKFAEQIGLNKNEIKECTESEKYKDEVTKDLNDAQTAGMTGTPGFVVGILKEDGTVEGKKVGGAYPIETFDQIIQEFLNK